MFGTGAFVGHVVRIRNRSLPAVAETPGAGTVQLIDTYDTIEGARRGLLGEPLFAVRIDSGDFVALSKEVRSLLDQAGMQHVKIMLSGDLNEDRIRKVLC